MIALAAELTARFAIGLGDPPLYVTDPEIEYLLAPSQDCRRFGNRILVNRYSMRSEDFPPHKTGPREVRVLVVGDSVVNGGNPTDHAALATTRLGPALAADLGRPVVVGNVSAGSWGPPNQLAYLTKFGLFDADVVAFVWNHEDWEDVPTFGPLHPLHQPTRKPVSAAWEGIDRYLLPRLIGAPPWPAGPGGSIGAGAAVEAVVRLARAGGCRPVAILHWSRPELAAGQPKPGLSSLREAAERAGVPVYDDADALRTAEGPPFRDDIHLNEVGQRALAELLRRIVVPLVSAGGS